MRVLQPLGKHELDKAAQIVRQLNPEKRWVVRIHQYKSNRTLPQNDRFHALIDAVAEQTGNDRRFLKEWAKEKFGPVIVVTVDGKDYEVIKPTHTYTVEEMSELMERFSAWASTELAIAL